MRSSVKVGLPDGRLVTLEPGDIVGRSKRAALFVDDPRLSEMHAYVSLRGARLILVSLRGRLLVQGRVVPEVPLTEGTRVDFGSVFSVDVVSVVMASEVFVLSSLDDAMPDEVIQGVTSLLTTPVPFVTPGFHHDAAAILWSTEDGSIRMRLRGEPDRDLDPTGLFEVDGQRFAVRSEPVSRLEQPRTLDPKGERDRLRIAVFFDSVHVHCGSSSVAIGGHSARIVSELAEIRRPVEWQSVAETIWPGVAPATQRSRWDQAIFRVRSKLREGNMRPDLIRSTHNGLFELYLQPGDTLKNRN